MLPENFLILTFYYITAASAFAIAFRIQRAIGATFIVSSFLNFDFRCRHGAGLSLALSRKLKFPEMRFGKINLPSGKAPAGCLNKVNKENDTRTSTTVGAGQPVPTRTERRHTQALVAIERWQRRLLQADRRNLPTHPICSTCDVPMWLKKMDFVGGQIEYRYE